MKTAWQASAIETKPNLTDLQSIGYPTNGDRAKGIPATQPGAAWYYMVALCRDALIDAVGETPDWKNEGQYLEAVKKIGMILNAKSIVGSKLADATITSDKLAELAQIADLEAGTVNKIVTASVLKNYLDSITKSICPVGSCQCFLDTKAPTGWLIMDGSRIDLEDAPELVQRLWAFNLTKGDGKTYAVLPDMNGRVFQGTTNVAAVCTYLEAELPNITGWLGFGTESKLFNRISDVNGSFYKGNKQGTMSSTQNGGEHEVTALFDASRSSSIYNGSKMQAAAIQLLACIKL